MRPRAEAAAALRTRLRDAARPLLCEVGDAYTPDILALAFTTMKRVPALYIVARALEQGHLEPGGLLLESSSGTMARGLAEAACIAGCRLRVVTDSGAVMGQETFCRSLKAYGTALDVVDVGTASPQQFRLARLHEVLREDPGAYWVRQYDNPANAEAYTVVAEALADRLQAVDFLVGPVGSGGSLCGLGNALRREHPGLRLVAVDTWRSVLFGQEDGRRKLRGLGNSILPRNLEHQLIDEVHWVSLEAAVQAVHALLHRHGVEAGPTSGAAWLAARAVARRNPGARVAVIFPDDLTRYAHEVLDPGWLAAQGIDPAVLPEAPIDLAHPREMADGVWGCFAWRRQTFAAVLGASLEEVG